MLFKLENDKYLQVGEVEFGFNGKIAGPACK